MVDAVAMVTVSTPDLDSNDASSFENEVTSFKVFIGGAAKLNVHLLSDEPKQNSSTLLSCERTGMISPCARNFIISTFPLLSMAEAV